MAADKVARASSEELVERFLAGYAERTRQAYASDLEDFARSRGQARAEAVAELLGGREQGRRLALDFAVEMRRRGLTAATVRRRLNTLSSLVGLAGELGVVKWSLEAPNEEEVAAAEQVGQRGASGDVPYLLPHHAIEATEIDRLDVQHHAVQERLGANYLAPLKQPSRILDVGCGTGLWAYELCAEFPEAQVVGLDLVPSKQPWPAAYRFVRANLLQGLPFADDRFDFVHQRFLRVGVPVRSWQVVVQDLVRVARPGGWVELVESAAEFEPAGAASERLGRAGAAAQQDPGAGLDRDRLSLRRQLPDPGGDGGGREAHRDAAAGRVGGPNRLAHGHGRSRPVHAGGAGLRGPVRRPGTRVPRAGHGGAAGVGGAPHHLQRGRRLWAEARLICREGPRWRRWPPATGGQGAQRQSISSSGVTGSAVSRPVSLTSSAM
jgi:SAM-dependent methyltransferase